MGARAAADKWGVKYEVILVDDGSRDRTWDLIADFHRSDPRWKQVLPSTELVSWRRQWPVVPTHVHGGLRYGTISAQA